AGQRELEAAADGVAVDLAHHRIVVCLERLDGGVEGVGHELLGLLLEGPLVQVPDVVPRREHLARARDHETAGVELADSSRQGTTGSTCIVFDEKGHIAGRAYREFEQHFPRPGWVEHDANEIWDVTGAVAHEALDDAGIDGGGLKAIGITNQRETVVAWDRDS